MILALLDVVRLENLDSGLLAKRIHHELGDYLSQIRCESDCASLRGR
jgi:hypothetical protein